MTPRGAYYNEHDRFAAAWLRELIKAGHIAPGEVDERDIQDVAPADLVGYRQCHFFAGIGCWSYALRFAGWPDDHEIWTGSCPCQPFSAAGKRGGFADERHLWPAFFHLICECGPPVVFGEQVANQDAIRWFDLVQSDLEGAGYAFGTADLCAAGVGAPHNRSRLYFVADSRGEGRRQVGSHGGRRGIRGGAQGVEQRPLHGGSGNMGNAESDDKRQSWQSGSGCAVALPTGGERGTGGRGRDSETAAGFEGGPDADGRCSLGTRARFSPSPTGGFWADADWLFCRDEKWRAVEPGTFPLAHGPAARVGRLRGYGNALCAPLAAAFIAAYLEASS